MKSSFAKFNVFLAFILIASGVTMAVWPSNHPVGQAASSNASVFFSPNGGCTDAILSELNKAKSTVLVQAYTFTSAPIAQALVDAHRRGVNVRVILDKSQGAENYYVADLLRSAGIGTFIDTVQGIAHNKIMIIDGHIVITGSFNFTKTAETKNAENLLVIDDLLLAGSYTENWNNRLSHSVPCAGKQSE
jgi:phosphatidylserine/phosphatidylglycerophosphate/cardiolipin synthase-like enzyme